MKRKTPTLDFTTDNGQLTVRLPERLDTFRTGTYWEPLTQLQQSTEPTHLTIDASSNTYCDGAGMTLLQALAAAQTTRGHTFSLSGASEHFQKTFEHIASLTPPSYVPEKKPSFLYRVGKSTHTITRDLKNNVGFIGELAYDLVKHISSPVHFRWHDFWTCLERVGPNALPIAALLGFILGLILSFQAMMSLQRFGADIYVVNLVNISLMRELAPLMTAIILAGRTASAYAAELGTMKMNREIDALATMGLKPISFLVIPRLIATTLMAPLLNIYIILFGYVGCFVVVISAVHSFPIFFHQLCVSFRLSDFVGGLFKCLVFGVIISSIGCLRGLKTNHHAAAVGESTTKAVVSSIIMLGITDGILSFIYYFLGI